MFSGLNGWVLTLRICYRLKTTELDFFAEYCDVMKPLAKALDLLQGEGKTSYMGYLLPTLILLQVKLRAKQHTVLTCAPLIDALLAGIARRFASVLQDPQLAAAAITHPKFRTGWTQDAAVVERGKLY